MSLTAEQIAEARVLIEQAASNGHAPAGNGWAQPAPAASFATPAAGMGPAQVLVPIKVQTPNGGSLRVYFAFPGEVAANPQALMGFLAQLAGAGMPLDVYTPKSAWGGGGGGYNRNGGGGGGWGGQRGGW